MNIRSALWGRMALVLVSCCVLSSCGGGGEKARVSKAGEGTAPSTSASATREAVTNQSAGHVVGPAQVPTALQHSGLTVTFRPGPTPAPFVRTFYGTARNSQGATVTFGFFLASGTDAAAGLSPAVERLVPDATSQGTVAGESYVEVTSAGAGSANGSRRNKEEFEIADRLEWRVARLAGAAFDEEGP